MKFEASKGPSSLTKKTTDDVAPMQRSTGRKRAERGVWVDSVKASEGREGGGAERGQVCVSDQDANIADHSAGGAEKGTGAHGSIPAIRNLDTKATEGRPVTLEGPLIL